MKIQLYHKTLKVRDLKMNNLGQYSLDIPQCELEGKSDDFNMCHGIEKNRVIILLETNDKCKNNQNTTSQNVRVVNQTIEKKPSTLEIISKMT